MLDQDDLVLLLVLADHRPPGQGQAAQIERGGDALADELLGAGAAFSGRQPGNVDDLDVSVIVPVVHLLVRDSVALVERGAEDGLSSGDHLDRAPQRLDVERADDAHGRLRVVGDVSGCEPVEEPHLLLLRGQGSGLAGSGTHDGREPRAVLLAAPDHDRQPGDRRGAHDVLYGQLDLPCPPDLIGDLHERERVASQVEHRVVHTEFVDTQDLTPDLHQADLDGSGGRPQRDVAGTAPQQGLRERVDIYLSVAAQRERVHDDIAVGDVRRRQCLAQVGPQQSGGGNRVRVGGNDVGDQLTRRPVVARCGQHMSGRDVRVGRQVPDNLLGMDTLAPDLDQVVRAAEDAQVTLCVDVPSVARAVETRARPTRNRVGDEAVRGEHGIRVVALRDAGTTDVDLAGFPGAGDGTGLVKDPGFEPGDGRADGKRLGVVLADALGGPGKAPGRGCDRALGQTVRVDDIDRAEPAPGGQGGPPRHIAAHDQQTQGGADSALAGLQPTNPLLPVGGGNIHDRHGFFQQEGRELLDRGSSGREHHDFCAGPERTEDLFDGNIEGVGRELQNAVGRHQTERGGKRGSMVGQARVRDSYGLRHAGGSGSEQHVGGLFRVQWLAHLGVGRRRHPDRRNSRRTGDLGPGVRSHAEVGETEHALQAVTRMRGVQRQESRAGLSHREQRGDEIDPAREHDRHHGRGQARPSDSRREAVGHVVQFGIRERAVPAADRCLPWILVNRSSESIQDRLKILGTRM